MIVGHSKMYCLDLTEREPTMCHVERILEGICWRNMLRLATADQNKTSKKKLSPRLSMNKKSLEWHCLLDFWSRIRIYLSYEHLSGFIWTLPLGIHPSIFPRWWYSNFTPHSFLRSIQPICRKEFNFAVNKDIFCFDLWGEK